ncbi:MAG: hypothetical protein MPEBLZ_00184 [Candidatus Methanoperedens nitroreducens]|uniref:Uncharacterized protein n=1 Tax=Candidatus Methanoperedens nitratireducens TaxID=1392998 RepID=A0A0P8CDV7_9EURY|nr:MAG: hypothetical protein MPEBLZ_00184 [Candidatus Methanoperedens sp. BLZ1]
MHTIKRAGNENNLNMRVNMMLKKSLVDKKELTEMGNVIIKYFPNQLDLKGESIYGKIYPPCSNRKRR